LGKLANKIVREDSELSLLEKKKGIAQ